MTTAYPYRDAGGRLRYTVERHPGKEFRIVAPDGRILSDPVPEELALLYRLPELLAAEPARTVYVCEGEKDAETLAELGLIATTTPCGTRLGWLPRYTPVLAGRHVVILPDADGPGRRHAEGVLEHLRGTAATAIVVDLHEPRSGPWDVTDWLGADRTVADLERRVCGARLAAAGLPDRAQGRPTKPQQVWLLLHSGLSTAEKLLLMAVQECLGWAASGPLPPASHLAELASLHRVTVQRTLGGLREHGLIAADRREHAVHWDLLAGCCAARGHQFSARATV